MFAGIQTLRIHFLWKGLLPAIWITFRYFNDTSDLWEEFPCLGKWHTSTAIKGFERNDLINHPFPQGKIPHPDNALKDTRILWRWIFQLIFQIGTSTSSFFRSSLDAKLWFWWFDGVWWMSWQRKRAPFTCPSTIRETNHNFTLGSAMYEILPYSQCRLIMMFPKSRVDSRLTRYRDCESSSW